MMRWAYLAFFVNPYLLFDEEINKRTIFALRGNTEITQHINTIVDYSLLWLISIENEYTMTGDVKFLENIYPKMESLMELCKRQTDKLGFLYGRQRDWIYIDWTNMDKEGTVCAEQMLLLKSYQTMQTCGRKLGKDVTEYQLLFEQLKKNIEQYFWNPEKGAYIDSYVSGRNHVTRHANIFAILFELVDGEHVDSIVKNVLFNPDIPQITTPYFKFFELDVLGKLGYLDQVMESIRSYWGGMIDRGAVTFWEEYNPQEGEEEQYAMYGDPFGKSLCHAWGASPIYLLGKYFLGVEPTSPGYETFRVKPALKYFNELDCIVPVRNGEIRILYHNGKLDVSTTCEGGTVVSDLEG